MNSTILKYLLPILLGLINFVSLAQVELIGRYEKEMKSNDEEFLIVSMKKNGLSLFREKDKFERGNRVWELIILDTLFREHWTAELEINGRLNLIGHDCIDGKMYYLFRRGDSNIDELTLYEIDSFNREVITYSIQQDLDFRLTHFSVMGKHALLGGYINKQPLVTIYDMREKSNKIVPGFFLSNVELLDLRPNVNNTFNTLLVERDTKENRKLILKTFDESGTLLMDDEIALGRDRYILSALTTTLQRDEMIVLGTWSISSSMRQATGLFSLMIDPFNQQTPIFYDFAQFSNFLNYMKPKRVSIIKENSLSRRIAGKIPEFKTYVNPIRIEETAQGFALLSEVYMPSSSTNTVRSSSYYNPYGLGGTFYNPYGINPYYNRYYNPMYAGPVNTDADDSRALHSSVVEFDPTGKYITDYGLKLNDLKLSTIDQASDFILDGETATLVYKKEKYLRQGVFDRKGNSLKSDTVEVKLNTPTETIRNETNNGSVRYWYGSSFYVWGYHTVTDISKRGEDRNRYVFYIHKLKK